MRPAGLSRSSETWPSASPTSARAGRKRVRSCSPASVGATLRVVRNSKRTPSLSSSARMEWLIAEGETPSRFAARVKLRSSATIRNADRVVRSRSLVCICELYSQEYVDLCDFSRFQFSLTLELESKEHGEYRIQRHS